MKYRRTVGGFAALATLAGGSAFVALAAPSYAGSVTGQFSAKGDDSSVDVLRGSKGKVTGLVAKDKPIDLPSSVSADDPKAAAKAHVSRYAPALGISAGDLEVTASTKVPEGMTVRFEQAKEGLPVIGGEFVAALDTEGNLQALVGEGTKSAIEAVKDPISQSEGASLARDYIAKQKDVSADLQVEFQGEAIYDPSLLGVPGANPVARQVLKFRVYSGPFIDYEVLVDQNLKSVVLSVSNTHAAMERKICDLDNQDAGDLEGAKCDGSTNAYTREEGDEASGIEDVDAVYDQFEATSRWYASYVNLGLTSLLGKADAPGGKALRASTRVCASQVQQGCPMDNAFFSGGTGQMYFGDGWTMLDVTAHELTHGVTNATSELKYIYQSGAINESMSDVFAELIDLAQNPDKAEQGKAFIHGDEHDQKFQRNLIDPTQSGQGPQPDKMTSEHWFEDTEFYDNGGVHYNSGVGNKAAALITLGGDFNGYQIKGLGLAKTFKIYWTAQNLLTSGSDYKDLYNVLPLACNKNVGRTGTFVTKDDCAQIDKAVRATEMYKDAAKAAPVATPYCEKGTVNRSFFDGFEGENSVTFQPAGSAGLAKTHFGYPYVNTGKDAGMLFTQSGSESAVFEQAEGVDIPEGSMLRIDYASEFGAQFPDEGNTTAKLQYNAGSGWEDASGLEGSVNPGPWTGHSNGWSSAKYDLSSLAGENVKFRFVQEGLPSDGTYSVLTVDNFKIYTCS